MTNLMSFDWIFIIITSINKVEVYVSKYVSKSICIRRLKASVTRRHSLVLDKQKRFYVIVLSSCKQDNWRMRKRTSAKLGRHGQWAIL